LQKARSKRLRQSFHSIRCRSRSKNHHKSPHRLLHPIHCRNSQVPSQEPSQINSVDPWQKLSLELSHEPSQVPTSDPSHKPPQEPFQEPSQFPTRSVSRAMATRSQIRSADPSHVPLQEPLQEASQILLLIRSTNPHESQLIRHTNLC